MAKIKFAKSELKRQRDALQQYERYLPILQLKKQQLQIESMRLGALLEKKRNGLETKTNAAQSWAGLLATPAVNMRPLLTPQEIVTEARNIAGVDVPVFRQAKFIIPEYDLFVVPLWVDTAVEALRELVSLRQEIVVLEKARQMIKQELRITTQRVNLFEKVKIPEARESIRRIKIYIGDQMANAVGRSKIAKKKLEALVLS